MVGFLIQETDFPFEILIHDDASTDKTADIIREYELKYPHLIKPIYQKENQYSKGVGGMMATFNFPRARGKYIALCEGDDYWTDPEKLQKQVDFLEANPEYSLTVGGFRSYNIYTNETKDIIEIHDGVVREDNGYSFDLKDTRKGWITKTLTTVFRNNKTIFIATAKYKYGRDNNLFYHILKTGKGFYFTEVLGVYRIHEGGINSMKKGKINTNAAYNVYKELFEHNKEEHTRIRYFYSSLSLINYNIYNKYQENSRKRNVKIIFESFFLIKTVKELGRFMLAFFPPRIKYKIKKILQK